MYTLYVMAIHMYTTNIVHPCVVLYVFFCGELSGANAHEIESNTSHAVGFRHSFYFMHVFISKGLF